jgi:Ca-activated chloride channel family protein
MKPWRTAAKYAIAIAAGVALFAQGPKTFRVDVQLVRILATVKDAHGGLVANLNKEDFQIFDNGAQQEIRVFEKHTSQPLSVATLMDISGSTAKDLKYEVQSMDRFFRALFREGNPDDRSALISFNWEVVRQTPFTRDLGALEKALRRLKAEAGTALYDAIELGAKYARDREGRHVMVVVTDGGDTISTTTYHEALRALHDSDTVFYAILVMPITNEAGRNIGGENALTSLAASTGGRVFQPSIGSEMDAAFDDILRELRTQYLLGFYPKNVPLTKNAFHRIEIKTKQKELHVISRTGYYGEFNSE